MGKIAFTEALWTFSQSRPTFLLSFFLRRISHFLDTWLVTGLLQVLTRHFFTFSSFISFPWIKLLAPFISLAWARRSRNRKHLSHRQASRSNPVNSMANSCFSVVLSCAMCIGVSSIPNLR